MTKQEKMEILFDYVKDKQEKMEILFDYVKDKMTEQEKMEILFDYVKDKTDWRNPIDATVSPLTKSQANEIASAITYFTGTVAEISPVGDGYNFISEGYRMGPCGP